MEIFHIQITLFFELSIFRQLSEYINDYSLLSPKGGGVALYFLMPSR